MEEVALREPRGIHTTIQVVRASDYHDTWDRVGRHWICPLPLNPLGDVVHEALARFLPWELVRCIWSFVSWPDITASEAESGERRTTNDTA